MNRNVPCPERRSSLNDILVTSKVWRDRHLTLVTWLAERATVSITTSTLMRATQNVLKNKCLNAHQRGKSSLRWRRPSLSKKDSLQKVFVFVTGVGVVILESATRGRFKGGVSMLTMSKLASKGYKPSSRLLLMFCRSKAELLSQVHCLFQPCFFWGGQGVKIWTTLKTVHL